MNKTIRIVLYVLSILTVAGVIAAAILTGGQAKPASAPGATAEEEQAEMSDAEATLDGEATADGSGISMDGFYWFEPWQPVGPAHGGAIAYRCRAKDSCGKKCHDFPDLPHPLYKGRIHHRAHTSVEYRDNAHSEPH